MMLSANDLPPLGRPCSAVQKVRRVWLRQREVGKAEVDDGALVRAGLLQALPPAGSRRQLVERLDVGHVHLVLGEAAVLRAQRALERLQQLLAALVLLDNPHDGSYISSAK